MNADQGPDTQKLDLSPGSYAPPRMEKILTPEDLEREVQYAGVPVSPPPTQ